MEAGGDEDVDHFEDGREAFILGMTLDECPYDSESEAGIDWEAGWMAGSEDEEDDEDE